MDLSKVGYSFLIILALTLDFGFFWGEYNKLANNNFLLLLTAAFVNTLCVYFIFQRNTKPKEKFSFKGREILFATSLVTSLQLWLAIVVWIISADFELTEPSFDRIISLSGGALLANVITTCIVVLDALFHNESTSM
ncbi:MAG: hypothetical protein L3J75_12000 [Methylococcaceae bacterium]|nr:hypothetical protein [Methylococcaceae bacterium]